MKTKLIAGLAMAGLMLSAGVANAAPCKDAKGRFVKCAKPAAPAVKKAPCKDAKGRFIKCK